MSWWRRGKALAEPEPPAPEPVDPDFRPTRILVLGKAKTGTTYLSKMLQQALAPCDFVLEPKSAEFVRTLFDEGGDRNVVIKIIYEHWDHRPNLRRALLANEMPIRFNKKLLIVRDPRDELLSRLLYIVKPLKDQDRLTAESLERWLRVLKAKEADPESLSVTSLITQLDEIFGTRFLKSFQRHLNDFSTFFAGLPKGIHVVRYEDLIDGQVGKLQHYLGFDVNLAVERDDHIERTLRSGAAGNWRAAFTEDDVQTLCPMMEDFLRAASYDTRHDIVSESLPTSDWSEYVEQLAER